MTPALIPSGFHSCRRVKEGKSILYGIFMHKHITHNEDTLSDPLCLASMLSSAKPSVHFRISTAKKLRDGGIQQSYNCLDIF